MPQSVIAQKGSLKKYPKMTKLKSKLNQLRQSVMNTAMGVLHKKSSEIELNMYLSGMYAPVPETHQTQLKVKGQIPAELQGILLRSGPNPLEVTSAELHHWFMGDGMLHGLKMEQGQPIWFKSKYIQTDTVQKYFGQPTKPGFRRGPSDLVNTNAFFHADKIWAMIEAGTYPACLDNELNTEFHGLLNSDADLPFSAHPHVDPETGHVHVICYDALDLFHVYYESFDEHGKMIHYTKIPVPDGVMIHDCAITQKDVLIFDFPVTFSAKQLMKGFAFPYTWNDKHQARIGVLPLYGQASQIQWIHLDPCFVFHAANAYRNEQDQIILDVVVHDCMFKASGQGPLEQQHVAFERWTVDLVASSILRKVVDDCAQEFPRIDERFTGRAHRYVYSAGFSTTDPTAANQLFIHDLVEERRAAIDFGEDWVAGEAVFVPGQKSAQNDVISEGEGYLLAYVHHRFEQPSKVVIFAVKGIRYELQAEILLESKVPLGFHCSWIDLNRNATERKENPLFF